MMVNKTFSEIEQDLLAMKSSRASYTPEQLKLFGMDGMRFLGIDPTDLRAYAEMSLRPDHSVAVQLWSSKIFEMKYLACLLADPAMLTAERLREIAGDVTSWVMIDICCTEVISRSPIAMRVAVEWSETDHDGYIYAGFKVIANLAQRLPDDDDSLGFFDRSLFTARKQASRKNEYVSRAIASALRLIGGRSNAWHEAAIETCREIAMQPSREARWVASQSLGSLLSKRRPDRTEHR